ncbi:MAG: VTT domain-containing protein [Anaerolineales bacterium]|nr:VTT domain-containing protein [Anaerolineales bacterium]
MQKATQRKKVYQRLGAVVLAVVVSLAIAAFRDELARFERYGYAGVFLISLLGNATVIFPAPSLAFVLAMGGVLNPLLVGLVAGVGEALGELTGYLAGYGGRAVIEDWQMYERLDGWMRRNGVATIFALSLIPNLFFDLAGIAAGAMRFPLGIFLLSCWLGKTMKTLCVAFAGAYSIGFIERLLGG